MLRPVLLAGLAGLTLAGCGAADRQAPVPAESLVPLPSEQPAPPAPAASETAQLPASDQCGAGKLGEFVNQLPTTEAMDKVSATVGHDRIRAINPGDAITQDLRSDRLNIEIGADGRIKQFRCY